MAFTILFNCINVNTLDTDSAITIGENGLSNWKAPSKNNFGNGMYFGINYTFGAVNSIFDPDCVDIPVNEMDFVPSPQIQTL